MVKVILLFSIQSVTFVAMKKYTYTYSECQAMHELYKKCFYTIFYETHDAKKAGEQADIAFMFNFGLDHHKWLDWYHSANWSYPPDTEITTYDVSPD